MAHSSTFSKNSRDESSHTSDIVVVTPVFNDWIAFQKMLLQLDKAFLECGHEVTVLAVDDGSSVQAENFFGASQHKAIQRIDILHLRRNLGHQRAIAIGLAYVEAQLPCRVVVVMDCDGEDQPADVPKLLEKVFQEGNKKIVFAERLKRSEGWVFAFFYACYRLMHRVVIGRGVRIGNFSAIPAARLPGLSVTAELWNHYAAAVVRSRIPYVTLPTSRGKRLDGKSKMNFVGLVTHGLSAMSVFADVIGVRLLVAVVPLIIAASIGAAVVAGIRFGTSWAVPGWATIAGGVAVVFLMQAVMFGLHLVFVILGHREGAVFIPRRDYMLFVEERRTYYQAPHITSASNDLMESLEEVSSLLSDPSHGLFT